MERSAVLRTGRPRFKLALAAYSFRSYFRDYRRPSQPAPAGDRRMDMFAFIDFCAEHGCDGAELTSYYLPQDPLDATLTELRLHAFLQGLAINGSAVGNRFSLPPGEELEREIEYTRKWIRRTALMGGSHLRVFAGPEIEGMSLQASLDSCVDALRRCADLAGQHGVMLGLENHGGIVSDADRVVEIVERVNHPWLKVNLDTGNFYSDRPYEDLEKLAPYAVNVQVKVKINRVPGGKEAADLERVADILKSYRYQGWIVLEYEEAEDPVKAVPPYLAQLRRLFP